jgi:hypothetical protein
MKLNILDIQQGRQVVFVLQSKFYGGNFCFRTFGDFAQSAILDLAIFTVRFTKEVPMIGFAVDSGLAGIDIHCDYIKVFYTI